MGGANPTAELIQHPPCLIHSCSHDSLSLIGTWKNETEIPYPIDSGESNNRLPAVYTSKPFNQMRKAEKHAEIRIPNYTAFKLKMSAR